MQRDVNKVYLPIRDRPLLEYCLETFGRAACVDRVVLVVREEDRSRAEELIVETPLAKPITMVTGGPTRHQSELAGLSAIAEEIDSGGVDLVAIHDGARPFLTLDLLERVIEVARRRGGAIPGLEVEEPLYQVTESGHHPLAASALRRVQTPQAFWAKPLLDAYRRAAAAGFEGVDTAETVERFSDLTVEVVPGDPRNIKVTFVEDFFAAEEYALAWDKGRWVAEKD